MAEERGRERKGREGRRNGSKEKVGEREREDGRKG